MYRIRNMAARFRKAQCLLLALCAMLSGLSPPAHADERQYKIEAAFLYSFFNYITWPGYDSPQDLAKPVICVAGNDPMMPYLEYIREKVSGERALSLRVVNGDTAGCNLLFMRHRMTANNTAPDTLTVLKPDDPLDHGGMIVLSEEGERMSIKINQQELEQGGFKVSSRLLDLAQRGR